VEIIGSNIFARGNFSIGASNFSVAEWDGKKWTDSKPLFQPSSVGSNGSDIYAVDDRGNLYELKLHSGSWSLLGYVSGWGTGGHAIAIEDSTCYALGDRVWKFSGTNKSSLGGSAYESIGAGNNHVYVSNYDDHRIYVDSNSLWSRLPGKLMPLNRHGTVIPTYVAALRGVNKALYIGGRFSAIDSTKLEPYGVAKWDGAQWLSLNGSPDTVMVSAISNDEQGNIFVVQEYEDKSTLSEWNSQNWTLLGTFISATYGYSYINSISCRNGVIAVAGSFTHVNGIPSNNIALLRMHRQ